MHAVFLGVCMQFSSRSNVYVLFHAKYVRLYGPHGMFNWGGPWWAIIVRIVRHNFNPFLTQLAARSSPLLLHCNTDLKKRSCRATSAISGAGPWLVQAIDAGLHFFTWCPCSIVHPEKKPFVHGESPAFPTAMVAAIYNVLDENNLLIEILHRVGFATTLVRAFLSSISIGTTTPPIVGSYMFPRALEAGATSEPYQRCHTGSVSSPRR